MKQTRRDDVTYNYKLQFSLKLFIRLTIRIKT